MGITDEELNSLTSAMITRHGIDFTSYEPKSLKRRIHRALTVFKIHSVHELWMKILREKDFVHLFVNELSVGLTAMFRDPQLWKRLGAIIPELIEKSEKLDVWHAGCSTGEEVYSFNIVLTELGLHGRVSSLATDINTGALDQAKQGQYHSLKLKEYNENYFKYTDGKDYLSRYYLNGSKVASMNKDLIKNVKFEKSNLITDKISQQFDIIFCRNVMIYFDSDAKKLVLEKFYKNLRPGGLLIIGFFDALIPIIDKQRFTPYDLKNKIFKRV